MSAREWLDAVEARHAPFPIYDECECVDPEVGADGHVEVEEVGVTCNLLYVACRTCCVENPDWPEQAEWCWDKHDHRTQPRCAVPALVAALRAVLDRCDGSEGQSRDVDDLIDDLRAAIDAHVPGGAS